MAKKNTETKVEEIALETKVENNSETKESAALTPQVLDLLEKIRNQKLVSGGVDPFFVKDSEKDRNFEYKWTTTDKDCNYFDSYQYNIENGWTKVEGFREPATHGYQADGDRGRHILVKIDKIIYNELLKIQNELNEKKKKSVYGTEITFKDSGRNKMGSKTVFDSDFLN